jgi:type IX secretion system PorP/SprF family membrane protein
MSLRTGFFIVFIVIWSGITLKGQDLVFSQYQKSPLLLNPGFAGVSPYPIFTLNYRNQWAQFDNAYVSYAGSYNQYFPSVRSGLGVQVTSDVQADGIIKQNSLGLYYSYTLEFAGDNFMKLGLGGTFGQTSLDWNRLIFSDQIDRINGPDGTLSSAEVAPNDLSSAYFDISTGFLFYNKKWFVGLGLFHLNTPNIGFSLNSDISSGNPLRYSIHAGYQIDLWDTKGSDAAFIQPMVLFTRQAKFTQLNVGAASQFSSILLGVFYRHSVVENQDAVIGMMGYQFDLVDVTYSYDYTVSNLGGSGGSHEIGVVFDLEAILPPRSKLNDCLKLFR